MPNRFVLLRRIILSINDDNLRTGGDNNLGKASNESSQISFLLDCVCYDLIYKMCGVDRSNNTRHYEDGLLNLMRKRIHRIKPI